MDVRFGTRYQWVYLDSLAEVFPALSQASCQPVHYATLVTT
jgi:hypothetical protein